MSTTYWLVMHDADLTETGSPMRRTYIKATWEGFPAQRSLEAERAILETFCFQRFGEKVAYVQGVAPTENWALYQINEERFDLAQPILWGGLPTRTGRIELGIGKLKGVNVIAEDFS